MPSRLHEVLLLLFRIRPELAPVLLRESLRVALPPYAEARIDAAELTDVQPAEYRADLVVLLYDDKPVLGIIVEVQLSVDEDKRYAVPFVTDTARARAEPELAVLSAMAHGHSAEPATAVQIATAAMLASLGLEPDRSVLYFDLVLASLSEAAKASLQAMDPSTYEFQSEFAKRYLSQGRTEGRAEGRSEAEFRILSRLLTLKFGALDEATSARLRGASSAELECWTERILSAASLDDVFR